MMVLRTSVLLVLKIMHAREMLLLKRTQSTNIYDYAPIAKALHTMDASVEQQMMTSHSP